MSVHITKQGLLDTVQDAGRYGYQHLGINPCGVMDNIAMQIANILVGNARNEPVIELHFPASSFLFEEECMIALSGANFDATINNNQIAVNTPVIVPANSLLEFTQYKRGARCYLAIHNGWNIEEWLSSYSTHIKAQCGGYNGRALKKNDTLQINPEYSFLIQSSQKSFELPIYVDTSKLYGKGNIRCIEASEYDWLRDDAKKIFISSSFQITPHSDRMGYCLHGEPLVQINNKTLLSSGVTKGTIQLLPSGQCIILMADHQTTGGYPKIAHVISADIPRLAQMRTNEFLQFEFITRDDAENAFIQQQQYLQQLEDTINLQLKQFFANDQH